MSICKIFLFLSLLILITSEEVAKNDTEAKAPEANEEPANPSNDTVTPPPEPEIPKIRNPGPFNMTYDEMDIMIACTYIVQEKLKQDKVAIDEAAKRMGFNESNRIIEKAGTDIFEKCTDSIDAATANRYVQNLTYINEFKWDKSFDFFANIDYNKKYINESDLVYSTKQNFLLYKFQKVNEMYRNKMADTRRNYEQIYNEQNQKITIGKFDIQNLPKSVKIGLFLGIFALFFLGTLYFLKSLGGQKITGKDKKKKKKTQ